MILTPTPVLSFCPDTCSRHTCLDTLPVLVRCFLARVPTPITRFLPRRLFSAFTKAYLTAPLCPASAPTPVPSSSREPFSTHLPRHVANSRPPDPCPCAGTYSPALVIRLQLRYVAMVLLPDLGSSPLA